MWPLKNCPQQPPSCPHNPGWISFICAYVLYSLKHEEVWFLLENLMHEKEKNHR